MAAKAARRRIDPRCPICGKAPDPAFTPFCSKRCADVDLHRWLGGHYRIETDEKPQSGDGAEEPNKG